MAKRIYDDRCGIADPDMGYVGVGMEIRSEISKLVVRLAKDGYDLADIQTFIIREAVNSVSEVRTHFDLIKAS